MLKQEILDKRLVQIVPSNRQLRLQQMEFYAFVHFTVNTFTGKEWGDGTEPESIFDPKQLDAKQWVRAIKAAGMKGLILTCKHHDGFCLWPSQYTEHTIANSPYRNGKGDLVKEVAEACQKGGIAFGIYLSPWDRNALSYGQGKAYDDYFVNQLTELLTGYGLISSVWLDGACGEGSNGKKQYYDFERYYEVIRKWQPEACIHVCGPDIRWCGNEAGISRKCEWSVVPERTRDTEKIAENSQQEDCVEFRERILTASDEDLGSRELLEKEENLVWYPAEVDLSIRPGWFYHEEEDNQVRSLEELLSVYFHAVGGNATLLLNIPPTKEGLLHENDVERLRELGSFLKKAFQRNLMEKAELFAEHAEKGHEIENVRKDEYDSYFKTEDGVRKAEIRIRFKRKKQVSYVVIKENITRSQRIEAFEICNEKDEVLYRGNTVGYQKIAVLQKEKVRELKIKIGDARVCPVISFIGVY